MTKAQKGHVGSKGHCNLFRYLDSIGIVGYLTDKLESANQILSFPRPCVPWQFDVTHTSWVSLCRQRLEPL